MYNPSFFDITEGRRLKTQGMEAAASWPFDEPTARARSVAVMLAKRNGEVRADDVWEYLSERLPTVLEALQPNCWGSIMRSPKLKFSGRVTESKRLTRHAGIQKIWEYAA